MKRLGALLASLLLAGSLTACGGAAAQEMQSVQVFAMDTVMGLQACGGETEAALAAAEDEIYRLDEALSRTREDSAVSRLNGAAARPVLRTEKSDKGVERYESARDIRRKCF